MSLRMRVRWLEVHRGVRQARRDGERMGALMSAGSRHGFRMYGVDVGMGGHLDLNGRIGTQEGWRIGTRYWVLDSQCPDVSLAQLGYPVAIETTDCSRKFPSLCL